MSGDRDVTHALSPAYLHHDMYHMSFGNLFTQKISDRIKLPYTRTEITVDVLHRQNITVFITKREVELRAIIGTRC